MSAGDERAAKQTCRRHRRQEFMRSDLLRQDTLKQITNCETAAHKTENEQRLGTHAHAATKTETECHLAAIGPSLEKVARAPTPASSGDTNHHVKSSPYKRTKKKTGRPDHVRPVRLAVVPNIYHPPYLVQSVGRVVVVAGMMMPSSVHNRHFTRSL